MITAKRSGIRVGYDARFSIGNYRGMGMYVRQLIAGFEQEFIGFCASGESDPTLNLAAGGFHFFPLWEQVSIPSLLRRYRTELFLAPYNTGPLRLPKAVELLLIVHDLIFLEDLPSSPSLYQNLGRAYRRAITPRLLDRARIILTVSNYTKEKIVARYGIDGHKIWVIPNSLDARWFQPGAHAPDPESYILMVSGQAPSKNLAGALESYALYQQKAGKQTPLLRIAGVDSRFHEKYRSLAHRLGVNERVDLMPYLTDEKMRQLYQGAELFWMPSLMEGFGTPLVEAMASGTPALASAATAIPEVGGDAPYYFNPTSVTEMADALSTVMAQPALRQTMSAAGRVQAAKYHPDVLRPKFRQFWASLGV